MSEKSDVKEPIDDTCATCFKEPALCLCAVVKAIPTRLHVLFLQHPQEPDKTLGSARLAHSILKNSTLRVGLSWPNLAKALGRPAENAKWGVLYLGGRSQEKRPPGYRAPRLAIKAKNEKIFSAMETGQQGGLEGLVVLDGTWSQAKTLWWRNAWLLKLNRIVITPERKSMYGDLRREPRRECLSTIESVAEALDVLGEKPEAAAALRTSFSELLKRFRGVLQKARASKSSKSAPAQEA
ncbi:MAG: DTW domain-containing protein [Deltaproteobacteria bacterium]|nr:DTW domain-containing protein [Deltaproteobacteria bacterium]